MTAVPSPPLTSNGWLSPAAPASPISTRDEVRNLLILELAARRHFQVVVRVSDGLNQRL